MTTNQYDLVVLGAGIGGYVAAIRAAQLGARVAIVEKQYLGSTCLNVGCIPSKAMLHVAESLYHLEGLEELGITLPGKPTLDMNKALGFKDKVVYDGLGTVEASRLITIKKSDGSSEQIVGEKIILATGSVPLIPPFPGVDGKNVMNSDTCWGVNKVPQSLICVGGGVIGVELACMYAALGTKVTIVEMMPNILALVDEEARKLLVRVLTKRGIEIVTGAKVESIADEGDLKKVVASTEKGSQSFSGEYVLMAVSRKANTSGLEKLIAQGLDTDRGRVRVNDQLETNLPGIYAIGDLIHGAGLAHVASMEGEVAADNALGHPAKMDYTEKRKTLPRQMRYNHSWRSQMYGCVEGGKRRSSRAFNTRW